MGLLAGSARSWPHTAPQRKYWPTEAWHRAAPGSQGMNASALAETAQYLRTTNQKSWDKKVSNDTWLTRHIDAFVVVRGGYMVHEQYWGPNGYKDVPHDVASATKSVAWMALAHAAMEGKLSLETKVADYFPNLKSDPPYLLKQVMSMDGGLNHSACRGNISNQFCSEPSRNGKIQ